jgi:hypothetical protein
LNPEKGCAMTLEELEKISDEELAIICNAIPRDLDTETLCKLEFDRRTRIKDNEYYVQRLEVQHQLNTQLVKEQVKWVKYSAIITASATILAALLGWYLGKESQELKTNDSY